MAGLVKGLTTIGKYSIGFGLGAVTLDQCLYNGASWLRRSWPTHRHAFLSVGHTLCVPWVSPVLQHANASPSYSSTLTRRALLTARNLPHPLCPRILISPLQVDGGERAVIFNRFDGVQQRVFAPGTHFKIPGIEEPTIYDVRTRPRVINTVTGTKDLQMVNISLRVLSRPKAEECHLIHSELGPDYDDRVLPSVAPEILKAVVVSASEAYCV